MRNKQSYLGNLVPFQIPVEKRSVPVASTDHQEPFLVAKHLGPCSVPVHRDLVQFETVDSVDPLPCSGLDRIFLALFA